MKTKELFFSLDIGTRTIVGILGRLKEGKFEILGLEVEEHKNRAMYDGQIHDTESVISAVLRIKERFENKFGIKLDKVSIAAAGRSLKTTRINIERDIDYNTPIDKSLIGSLEIEAVQKGRKIVGKDVLGNSLDYYCVGYAVVNYYLNGTIISKLQGHRGNKIGVEIIATFLPKLVVDSLYYVIEKSMLSVYNMTLEPIAAMDVSIQENFKLLNIALVDIGAGTSDIALTKAGSVFAFAMVPIAGDEITEKISQTYLLDFDTAEEVKLKLKKESIVDFNDIMGERHEIPSKEIIESIEDVTKSLGREIADKIIEYNGTPPSAVFLIGGSSQIPHIAEYISEYLGLSEKRVGVRNTNIIKDIIFDDEKIKGPEYITPIGIAVSANIFKEIDFVNIKVNGEKVKLLNTQQVTIADALASVGYNPRDLIGRKGLDLQFTLNGKNRIIRGGDGSTAIIFNNGKLSNLNERLSNGDVIHINAANDGYDAFLSIEELMDDLPVLHVKVDDEIHNLKPEVYINGEKVIDSCTIANGDSIVYKIQETISQVAKAVSVSMDDYNAKINGKASDVTDKVNEGDIVEFEFRAKEDKLSKKESKKDDTGINIWVNDEEVFMQGKKTGYIFADIFNYIDIDTKEVKGNLFLRINGLPANYADIIKEGDRIELWWD